MEWADDEWNIWIDAVDVAGSVATAAPAPPPSPPPPRPPPQRPAIHHQRFFVVIETRRSKRSLEINSNKKNIATYEKLVTQPNPLKQESFPLKSIDNYISDTNGWNDLAKRNSTSFHYPYEKTPLNKFTKLKEHMFQKLFQETAPNSRKCKLKCFLKLNGEGVCI